MTKGMLVDIYCHSACFLNFHKADGSSLGMFSEIYADRIKSPLKPI